jgi:uncharacterized membrane protein YoaK (UPF0700 family)
MFWAALLAGIAGYVDAISYIHLGGAFAANMTGNLVEIGIRGATGDWRRAAWCLSLVVAFLLGIVASRLLLRAHRSPRTALLIESAVIAAAGTGVLGVAAIPLLAAAMALQNEAATHGIVAVNVAFITGDIQRLGERLVAETVPGQRARRDGQPRLILAILVCYASGAGIGTLASDLGAPALFCPAGVLAMTVLLPVRWTRIAASEG